MKRVVLSLLLVGGLALPSVATSPLFTDVTRSAGVGHRGNGKGAAFADIDNDGYWDLFVSNKGGGNLLYRNNGDGTFADVTDKVGGNLRDGGFCMGSVFFDYDNDGWVDLFIPKGGRDEIESNRLLHNVKGKFVDVTAKAGVEAKVFTYAAAVADYDKDGFLDVYCANYGPGAKGLLYRNNGDGTFTDATDKAGLGKFRAWSWMAVWADVNGDGLPDLYVVNGRYPAGEPNFLFVNNGDGTFREEAKQRGVDDPNWGLGAAFADTRNSGSLDLFVSNYVGENALYVNDGRGYFKKAGKAAGLTHTGWGKGPSFGDLDNDGFVDLYEGDCKTANQLYRNNGNGTFTNVAPKSPDVELSSVRTKATVLCDTMNRGLLDLFVVNWGAPNRLFRNMGKSERNWLNVRLTGTASNRMAVGSRVWVKDGAKLVGMSELQTSSGFVSQPPQELHFGGLKPSKTYTVEVRFPSGIHQVLENVRPGQILRVTEPAGVARR